MMRLALQFIGLWFVISIALSVVWIVVRAVADRWLARRCALCRVRCEQMLHCRFGNVCEPCQDAVFRLYHYRRRLTSEEVDRLWSKLWRDDPLEGEGWRNGQ